MNGGGRSVDEIEAEGGRSDGGREFYKRNIGGTMRRVEDDRCIFAVRSEKGEASKIADMEERVMWLVADSICFFSGGSGGANRNVVSVSLLDGEGGELRSVLTDCFLETSKRLDFVEQGRIAPWKIQKLNCNAIAVSPEARAIEGGCRSHDCTDALPHDSRTRMPDAHASDFRSDA